MQLSDLKQAPVWRSDWLTIELTPADAGRYRRVPFTLAEGQQLLEIRPEARAGEERKDGEGFAYKMPRPYVDITVENPQGRLVANLMARTKPVRIGEETASPGCLPTSLEPGTWQLLVGVKALSEDLVCRVEIRQLARQPQLLVGETHMHSCHSDGRLTVERLLAKAVENRLDYLILTDHNTVSGCRELVSTPELTAIPGIELTWFSGHANLLGLAEPVRSFFANGAAEMADVMAEGRAAGAVVVINHPFDRTFDLAWKHSLTAFPNHLYEVWNGPYTRRNRDAVAWWQERLAEGERYRVIGGSDYHSDLDLTLGQPATAVWTWSRARADILAALEAGHSFIMAAADSPRVSLQCGDWMMGDVALPGAGEAAAVVRIELDQLRAGDRIEVWTAVGRSRTFTVPQGAVAFEHELCLPVDERFCRIEVWRPDWDGEPQLATLTNPLFLQED
ncbi:MAG: CehA/McbA family metallohydrolase [Bacillota bacterium]|nr:CehA/McbA family metallohydrolase [Bacillota bacterium]